MPSPDPLVGREIVVSVMDGGAKYRVQSVNRNRTLARLVLDGGAVVNGVYTGKTGDCFRCSGKGYQTDADRKRNRYYDRHVRRVHL